MSIQGELPNLFARRWRQYAKAHPHLEGHLEHDRGGTLLLIPRDSDDGFDVRLRCETWGVILCAGPWEDLPWESASNDWAGLCDQVYACVRALLSPDAYLLQRLRRDKLRSCHVRVRCADGWTTAGTHSCSLIPFGPFSRLVLQNRLLPSRWPYAAELLDDLALPRWEPGV